MHVEAHGRSCRLGKKEHLVGVEGVNPDRVRCGGLETSNEWIATDERPTRTCH